MLYYVQHCSALLCCAVFYSALLCSTLVYVTPLYPPLLYFRVDPEYLRNTIKEYLRMARRYLRNT